MTTPINITTDILSLTTKELDSLLFSLKNEQGFISLLSKKYHKDNIATLLLLNLEEHKRIFVTCENYRHDASKYLDSELSMKRDYDKIFPPLKQLVHQDESVPLFQTLAPVGTAYALPFILDLEIYEGVVRRANANHGLFSMGLEDVMTRKKCDRGLSLLSDILGNYALSLSYVASVEECYGIQITDKTKVLRMFFLELYRIYRHIKGLGAFLNVLRFESLEKEINSLKTYMESFIFKSFGGGNLATFIQIGAMSNEFYKNCDLNWINNSLEFIKIFLPKISKIQKTLSRNALWTNETNIFGMRVQDAIHYGLTGPRLRASGVNYDLRKVGKSFYFYNDVEFEIPLGINGDIYDLYLVRLEEMRQSFFILNQILDNIPNDLNKELAPINNNVESEAEIKNSYIPIEGPEGECGVWIHTNEYIISQMNIVSPDRNFYDAIPERIIGANLREVMLYIRSGHFNIEEIDL